MKKLLPLIVLGIVLAIQVKSQDRRFNAGAVFGINAAQIDGDDQSGYRKLGIAGGLRGTAELTDRSYISVELLYSQRGSKPASGGQSRNTNQVTIRLNYAEVPILFNYLTDENEEGRYRLNLDAGFSFGRLLNYEVDETSFRLNEEDRLTFNQISENFKTNDLSLIFGLAFNFSDHVAFGFRHSFSMSTLFDEKDFPEKDNRSLRSYFLSVRLVYML